MSLPTHVHDPLLNPLARRVRQRSLGDQPALGWVTANYLDEAYLRDLARLAPLYGAQGILWDESFFRWSADLIDKPAVADFLARARDAGWCTGILTADEESKKNLDHEFERWPVPVRVHARGGQTILDGAAERQGGGRLPYLAADRLIEKISPGEILVRVDRPGAPGPFLATWGNVFAVSAHLLAGEREPETLYAETCFGQVADDVLRAFELARTAVDKSFFVFDAVALMDAGHWPQTLDWFDRQVDNHPTLSNPSRQTTDQIDLEKIEALEAAHNAWRILDAARARSDPRVFLWLEHYFLRLKIVCLVLRLLADVYFSMRGVQRASLKLAPHVLKSKLKELCQTVREYRALLVEFEPRTLATGGQPLGKVLTALTKSL